MNKHIKEQWINALESGEYKQGRGRLIDNNGGYCCLAVLGDLAVKAGVTKWVKESPNDDGSMIGLPSNFETPYVHTGVLSEIVCDWAGLESKNPTVNEHTLANWNDQQGKTFKEIAQLIKENL